VVTRLLTCWNFDNIVIPKRRGPGQRDIVFDECGYDVEPVLIAFRKQQFRRDELVFIETIGVFMEERPPIIKLRGGVLTQRLVLEVVLQILTKLTRGCELFGLDDLFQLFIRPLNSSLLVDRPMLIPRSVGGVWTRVSTQLAGVATSARNKKK
jgi:hypothetical protein